MPDRSSLTKPTSQELENAKTKGQVIGWIQGAGAVLLLGVAYSLLGWIPLIAIGAVGLYVGYRVVFGGKDS